MSSTKAVEENGQVLERSKNLLPPSKPCEFLVAKAIDGDYPVDGEEDYLCILERPTLCVSLESSVAFERRGSKF